MNKIKIKLEKPIYVGMSILELSKELMYDFHDIVLKLKYGDVIWIMMTDDLYIYINPI